MYSLIIGELGELIKSEQFSDFKKQIENYSKRLNIDSSKDICILDKNGKNIAHGGNEIDSNETRFFLFNKQFYKEQLMKIFEDNLQKVLMSTFSSQHLFPEIIPVKLSMSNVTSLEKFGILEIEIKQTDEAMIKGYETARSLYKNIRLNSKICEKIKENYTYQFNSLECLYKNISNLYEQVISKYKEVELNCTKMNERNDKAIILYQESIEKLKRIEIHPKMQSDENKYLIDLYFDEVKMNEWRDKCIKSQESLTKKIKQRAQIIHDEKSKIRNEKNQNMIQLKNDWNSIISEVELSENENTNYTIISKIHDELNSYHKIIYALASLDNNANPDDLIAKMNSAKSKSQNNYISTLEKNNSIVENQVKKMRNLLSKASVTINLIFSNYHSIKKTLLDVMDNLNTFSGLLDNLEKDFSYLNNPRMFPVAYNASIIEIKRRLIFNNKILKEFEKLKQAIFNENNQRKTFIEEHGRFLTNDYVPLLKFSDLKLVIDFDNSDELKNLPQILEDNELEDIFINEPLTDSLQNLNKLNYPNPLINSNRKNDEQISENNQKLINEVNSRLKDELKIIKDSNFKKLEDQRRDQDDQLKEIQEKYKAATIKLSECEIIISIKEKEIKKLLEKLEHKDRKIVNYQSEIERLGKSIESLSENFLAQSKVKDDRIKEKIIENENLMKNHFKNSECLMCRDSQMNSLEYNSWSPYIKDLNEKLMDKNRKYNKIESRFEELVRQTQFIKKTFFNHFNTMTVAKNHEVLSIKQSYEGKIMSLEDQLTNEKIKFEILLKDSQKQIGEEMKKAFDEEMKNKLNQMKILEKKNIDIQKEYNELSTVVKQGEKLRNRLEIEMKSLKVDNELKKSKIDSLLKSIDEYKLKENSQSSEIKSKENLIENLKKEMRNFNNENEVLSKSNNCLVEENDLLTKENNTLNNEIEKKVKLISDLELSLANLKSEHQEDLNNLKNHYETQIVGFNLEIEQMKKEREVDQIKISESNELISNLKQSNNNNSSYLDQIESLKKSQQESQNTISNLEVENQILQKKLEEMNSNIFNKDKKISELNELTQKLFMTENNFLSTKNNSNTNNFNINEIRLNSFVSLSDNIEDEFVSIKKLEKGVKAIFVPYSSGVYVCINLNNSTNYDPENNNEFENIPENKFYKCNAVLSLDHFNTELKELLLGHSLIIIGRIGNVINHFATSENNPHDLPEESNYNICELDKIDYILGFQGDEMIFRNYIY